MESLPLQIYAVGTHVGASFAVPDTAQRIVLAAERSAWPEITARDRGRTRLQLRDDVAQARSDVRGNPNSDALKQAERDLSERLTRVVHNSEVVKVAAEISVDGGTNWRRIIEFGALGGNEVDEETGQPYTESKTEFSIGKYNARGRLLRAVLTCNASLTTRITIDEAT